MWLKILFSGWTWAGVLLVLLIASRLELAGLVICHQQELLSQAQKSEQVWADIIQTERNAVQHYYDVSMRLEQEKDKIENEKDAVIADLRSGDVRLRERFTCPTSVPNDTPASGERDGGEGRGLLEQDAEFLVRFAAEADARVKQLQSCQAVLKEVGSDRQE
jgi:hypothetical protein